MDIKPKDGKPIYDGSWYYPAETDYIGRPQIKTKPALPTDCIYDSFKEVRPDVFAGRVDILSYLFTSRRKYLIRRKGHHEEKVYVDELEKKKYIVVCCFYIPVLQVDDVAYRCHAVVQTFLELSREGKCDFEVVLVLRMRPDFPNYQDPGVTADAFSHFISGFPGFLAVPAWDSYYISKFLFPCLGTCTYHEPGCVTVDLELQKLVYGDFYYFSVYGADVYPFTAKRLTMLHNRRIKTGGLEELLACRSCDVLNRFDGEEGKTVHSLKNNVIGIFYFNNGKGIDKISDLYNKCILKNYEFEIVVVYAWCNRDFLKLGWKEFLQPLRENAVCSRWLVAPLSDKVSRRFCDLYRDSFEDKLMIVGPNCSFVELEGFAHYLEFGIDSYPFGKMSVWDSQVDRVRGLRFPRLLQDFSIINLRDSNGQHVHVSTLRGANVVLHLGGVSKVCDWEDSLPKWYEEIKRHEEQAGRQFEMIFVNTCDWRSAACYNKYCSKNPWLAAPDHYPYEDLKDKLAGPLYCFTLPTLVAFGSDGHLLTLELQSQPVDFFSQSPEALQLQLVRDVGRLLNSRADHWWHVLPIP